MNWRGRASRNGVIGRSVAGLSIAGLSVACWSIAGLTLVLIGPAGRAAAAGVPVPGRYVIPTGLEPWVADTLAGRDPLPAGCRLASAGIDPSSVTARFTCDGRPEVVVELRHPADPAAAHPAWATAQLALVAGPDAPPSL